MLYKCFNHHPDRPIDAQRPQQFPEAGPGPYTARFDTTFTDLRSAAEAGCKLCSLVYRGNPQLPDLYSQRAFVFVTPREVSSRVGVDSAARVLRYRFRPIDAPDFLWRSMKSAQLLDTDLAANNLKRVATWIETCQDSHTHPEFCRPNAAPLPQRVLELGDAVSGHSIRLHEASGEIDTYVALSYCWVGDTECARTLTSNLDDLQKKIDDESLPKNIRDGIRCNRMLKFRYLPRYGPNGSCCPRRVVCHRKKIHAGESGYDCQPMLRPGLAALRTGR